MMVEGDSDAHTWSVTVTDGGQAVDLSGYAIAVHIDRRDGTDLVVTGTADGNVATVTLPQAAYTKTGRLVAIMRATKDEQEVTLAAACWNVTTGPSGTVVVQTDVVPDIDQLLAQLGNLRQALQDAETVTTAANTARTELTEQVGDKVTEMTTLGENLQTQVGAEITKLEAAAMSLYIQGTDGKQYKGLLKNVDGKPVYEYEEAE